MRIGRLAGAAFGVALVLACGAASAQTRPAFEVETPEGWTRDNQERDGPGSYRVISPAALRAMCIVKGQDHAPLATLSQEQINADLAGGRGNGMLARSIPDARIVSNTDQVIDHDGRKAVSSAVTADTGQGNLRMRGLYMATPGRIYQIVCVGPEDTFAQAAPAMERVLSSSRVAG